MSLIWTRHEWKRDNEPRPSFVALVRLSPPVSPNDTSAIAEVEILDARFNGEERSMLRGTVKWDGCSDWHAERGLGSLHFCGSDGDHGRAGIVEFGKVLAWAHELAQACITASGTECE